VFDFFPVHVPGAYRSNQSPVAPLPQREYEEDGAPFICPADRLEALLGSGVRGVRQNHELTTKECLDRRY
jgi:hypothetical protein